MKIYLASASKARKKLLRQLGIKCKIIPSAIKEERKISKGLSYAGLVKLNALRKAKEVAGKVKNGIIIGADTIVVYADKIYGKPKSITDARNMLKKISQGPQWVYTGIAVIDKDSHKTKVSYERTKVFMDPLNDQQISNYFSQVSPLNKAGSFDIQGRGAFFIKRIEGCFYNVVGLPLRKLFRMLREINASLFIAICFFSLALSIYLTGCSTEYNIVTGKEEVFFYSTDKEVQMGQAISRQVEEKYKFVDDLLVQKRVEDIGNKIVSVCERKDIDYHFKALEDDEVNAVSLPGGYIYINKGLIDKVKNDDELAGVIAHEVAHVVARHSIKKLQAVMGYSLFRVLVATVPGSSETGNAADLAFMEILLGYSRDDELLADQLSTRYAKLAGYNPRGMITFLQTLQDINKRKPAKPKTYFKTHPYVPDRIRIVKQELGERIGFSDYINIEQEKK